MRSDEDKILQQIVVRIGGQDTAIPVRSIRDNAQFRRHLGQMLGGLAGGWNFRNGQETSVVLRDMLPLILTDGIEGLMQLPAVYAPDTDWSAASDVELVDAGVAILEAAFPLLEAVLRGMMLLAKRAQGRQVIPA